MKKTTIILSLLLAAPVLLTASTPAPLYTTTIPAPADLQDYVGTFKMNDSNLPFSQVVVSQQAGKLHYVAGEYEGDFAEVSGKTDTFTANEATVTFVRDGAGQVAKLRLEVSEGTFEGTKEMASFADYAARYKMDGLPFEHIVLTEKSGQLHYEAGEYSGVLVPVPNQADTFDANGRATFKFTRNDQKKVSRMVVEVQGQSYEGVPAK
ncbi:hypothetical protein GCM10027275_25940 [Rhabdobacter roseus]|uniref:Uncharacterized protein n=1 Tax=Rhabdobacter roseus TaxID=1655419 RepID=A0A840TX80_9BACT|nr:hypothetical protein [Rhabdobacter roseus]MBB5284540.1 hypothetical protein [Rhabdobacter roseus]